MFPNESKDGDFSERFPRHLYSAAGSTDFTSLMNLLPFHLSFFSFFLRSLLTLSLSPLASLLLPSFTRIFVHHPFLSPSLSPSPPLPSPLSPAMHLRWLKSFWLTGFHGQTCKAWQKQCARSAAASPLLSCRCATSMLVLGLSASWSG